ncbi:hypothetical protein A1O1_08088 [Capronia coronata CBS 617.96]|uniref:Uncharacterized protein n=1 Tax=Capronia coronata CBS 617.96 TaxID=1182541 RepID=W9XXD0_9EURO|nr:uncharacterized protein A1O1_08088 [Capronia coronata CBS 617.96]EXJ82020.1 hypothetical protein A1O1_08088 [Capronia coronata CBS 617.96]
MSEWDRKTEEWIPAREIEARNARLKAQHTSGVPESPNSHEEDDNEDDNDDLFDADGMPTKRRRTNLGPPERVLEIKKWTPIDPAIAETLPEPKYLADRRPGMESLYGGAYKATNGFGTLGINAGIMSAAVGFDLGDGSGLGNASGVLGSTSTAPEPAPAPVRRNMPPRRKKKKLGGPGRRKANPTPAGENNPAIATGDITMTHTSEGDNTQSATHTGETDTHSQGEADGSGSESEGEGSEEGEIEDAAKAHSDATAHTADLQADIQAAQTGTTGTAAHSDVTAPSTADTEMHEATSADLSSTLETSQAPTARQQAAEDVAMSEYTHIKPQPDSAEPSTVNAAETETAFSGLTVSDVVQADANANANAPNNPATTVEPQLEPELEAPALDQNPQATAVAQSTSNGEAPTLEQNPQATAVSEPTTEDVKTEDEVAATFEQVDEQTTAQDQNQTEPTESVIVTGTDTDMNDAQPTGPAQPEQEAAQAPAPTPMQVQTQPGEEQEHPQQDADADAAPEQAQDTAGEVDLLGGLEAAVEKEHRAL